MGTSVSFTLNTVEGRSKINWLTLSHFKKTAMSGKQLVWKK